MHFSTNFSIFVCKQLLTLMRENTDIRQEQIKQAVLGIIVNKNMEDLTIRNIARHVGFSETAIFRHFKDKQDMYISLLRDMQIEFIGPLNRIAKYATSLEEGVELFICSTIKNLSRNEGLPLVLLAISILGSYDQLKTGLWELFNMHRELIGDLLKRGIDMGEWDERTTVEDMTLFYMIIPVFVNIQILLADQHVPENELCKKYTALFLRFLNPNFFN